MKIEEQKKSLEGRVLTLSEKPPPPVLRKSTTTKNDEAVSI